MRTRVFAAQRPYWHFLWCSRTGSLQFLVVTMPVVDSSLQVWIGNAPPLCREPDVKAWLVHKGFPKPVKVKVKPGGCTPPRSYAIATFASPQEASMVRCGKMVWMDNKYAFFRHAHYEPPLIYKHTATTHLDCLRQVPLSTCVPQRIASSYQRVPATTMHD